MLLLHYVNNMVFKFGRGNLVFDYGLLIHLVGLAKGNRSLNDFCKYSGLEPSNISRLLNRKLSNPPKPSTLKLIASSSQGRVSIDELMFASGYIEFEDIKKNINDLGYTPDENIDMLSEIGQLKKDISRVLHLIDKNYSKEADNKIMDVLTASLREAYIVSSNNK